MFWDGRVSGDAAAGFATPAVELLPAGLDSLLAVQALFPAVARDEMRGGRYSAAGYSVDPGQSVEGMPGSSGWSDTDVFGQPNELAIIADGPAHFAAIWSALMVRLLAIPEYRELLADAYPEVEADRLTFAHAANALAAFEADAFTFVDTPWDRFLAGDDVALGGEALAGAELFFGRAGCATCHSGPFFSDQAYHNIGAPQLGPGVGAAAPLDTGRALVSGEPADRFAFRTPPLRNVALTGPWLHNGAYSSLEAVIQHHLRPAEALRDYDPANLPPPLQLSLQNHEVTQALILATLDENVAQPVALTGREIGQIAAFLEALTDPAARDLAYLIPAGVPSGLPLDHTP
jgi:cytochrome c peroxidase